MLKIVCLGGTTGLFLAAQVRRQMEDAHIVVVEKMDYVGFGYCSMPFALGGEVANDGRLFMFGHEAVRQRMALDIRLSSRALEIRRDSKQVRCQTPEGLVDLDYDKLVYALGSTSRGLGEADLLPGVFHFRFKEDLDAARKWIDEHAVRRVAVIGSGFVGLEVADNLRRSDLNVSIFEEARSLAPRLDPEMIRPVTSRLAAQGVQVFTGHRASVSAAPGGGLRITAGPVQSVVDLVVVATGVKPNTGLAMAAGLAIGPTGGIATDAFMRTSDPDIYCVGDAAELSCRVTGKPILVSLASPAFQQTKVAALHISGLSRPYPGGQNSFVCRVAGLTVGATGLTEHEARRQGLDYSKIILQGKNHVDFFPGLEVISGKVLFDKATGRLLGAQFVGGEGTDKRLDILATAVGAGLLASDLEFVELGYSPPYGRPRDIVNVLGSVAHTLEISGNDSLHPDEIDRFLTNGGQVIDIRTPDEFLAGAIPGAINIPALELRERLDGLDRNTPIAVCCQIGSKSTTAQKMLTQHGFRSFNLVGGYSVWRMLHDEPQSLIHAAPIWQPTAQASEPGIGAPADTPEPDARIDARGMTCPGPLAALSKQCKALPGGSRVEALATDPTFLADSRSWAERFGHTVAGTHNAGDHWVVTIQLKT